MANPLLQPEILEVVFSFLDGRSLLQSSHVCSVWKSTINHITEVTKIWNQCCEEEIQDDVLIDIATNLHPELWDSLHYSKWKDIYLCWLQWRNIGLWPYHMQEIINIPRKNESITCLRISGNVVITGHLNGGIHMWDLTYGHMGFLNGHLKQVTDLGLISIPVKTARKRSLPDSIATVKHHYVVSTSCDFTIKVTPLHPGIKPTDALILRQHVAPTTSVRVYRTMFVVSGDDGVTVWDLIPPSPNESTSVRLVSKIETLDSVEVVSAWKGKVTGITDSNRFYCVKKSNAKNMVEYTGQQNFAEKNSFAFYKFIWRHWVCAWLTAHKLLYIAVGEDHKWSRYNTMTALQSYPTAVLLYGNLFILGMESGAVCLYIINTSEDLLTLDLNAYHWKQSVSCDPILFMDIAEDKAEPIIVASSGDTLYYISFQPS